MIAEPLRATIRVSGFLIAWTVLAVLLSPILVRINDGRWDWRKVRPQAVRLAVGSAQLIALMLTGAGVYRLAVSVTGGWPSGWGAAAVGAIIGAMTGAALGVPANLVAARCRITGWLDDYDHAGGVANRRAS